MKKKKTRRRKLRQKKKIFDYRMRIEILQKLFSFNYANQIWIEYYFEKRNDDHDDDDDADKE